MDEQAQAIEYNVHEDYRFPVVLLYRALWVLENHGYAKFRNYVARVNAPSQDIERVINKYQYRTDLDFKKKIDKKIQNIREKTGVEIKL